MTDAGTAKPRDGDVQDILAKPSTPIGEDQSHAAGPLLGSRQYLHASIRQRNRQRPFLALLSLAARSGNGPHLGFEIDLTPIGQQRLSGPGRRQDQPFERFRTYTIVLPQFADEPMDLFVP